MGREAVILRISEWIVRKAARVPIEANRKLARLFARMWYRVDGRHRQIAMDNLGIAFGREMSEARLETICRESFQHLARVLFELPYLHDLTPEALDGFVTFTGIENYFSAQKKGKGVLFMASHFGNWELMALAFSLRYQPAHSIVRPLDNPHLDRVISLIRSRGGNQLIPKKGSVKHILRLLNQGETVAILMDQNVGWKDGVFVPFFGKIACTTKSLAVLALRTGAAIVPAYNYRLPDGRYRTVIQPEVAPIDTGDRTGDIEETTALLNSVVEGYVRLYPEQWLWVHRRWKQQPHEPWPRVRRKKKKRIKSARA